jgi:predicted transcriptional regulator
MIDYAAVWWQGKGRTNRFFTRTKIVAIIADDKCSQEGRLMRRLAKVGRMELEVLRFIADHSPVTVRDVAEHFAKSKGYARTTILTVMERLRQKGYLTRKKVGGTYQYFPRQPKMAIMQSLVRDFVQNVLGGSILPFIAYLTQEVELSDEELRELQKLVQELDARREEQAGRTKG